MIKREQPTGMPSNEKPASKPEQQKKPEEQKEERLAHINRELEGFNDHPKNQEEEKQIRNKRGTLYQKTLDGLEKTLGKLGADSKKMVYKTLVDDSIEHAQRENKRFDELHKEKDSLEGGESKKSYTLDDVANYFDDKSGQALEQYKAEKDPKERQSIFNTRQLLKDFEFKIQNADYAEPEDFEGILRDLEDRLGSFTGVDYSPKTGEYRGLADTRSVEERNKIREFVDIINKKRYPGVEMQEMNGQAIELQLSKFANETIAGSDGDKDTVIYCQKVLKDFKGESYELPLEFIESTIEGYIFRNENMKDENYVQNIKALRNCREFLRNNMRVQEKP